MTASTQAFGRTIAVLALQLVGSLFGDEIRLVVVDVIERQFGPGRDGLGGEEGEVVNVVVGVVVGDGVDGAVGVAGVVDEAGRASEVQAVAHVRGSAFLLAELVQAHEVDALVRRAGFPAPVGFLVGDDFAAVGVDELASL